MMTVKTLGENYNMWKFIEKQDQETQKDTKQEYVPKCVEL